MSEKLKKCKCPIAGHGIGCEVALEKVRDLNSRLSRIRRLFDKKEIREQLCE